MMHTLTKPIASFLFLFLLSPGTHAQNTHRPQETAFLNFNVGNSTLKHREYQKVSLFGCHTVVTIDSATTNGLHWNTANQVVPGIPYGPRVDSKTKESYFVSKYYVASPPVFKMGPGNKPDSNTVYDIGIVTPDAFELAGDKPVQLIFMNYDVLKPMHIEYLPVEFDSSFDHSADTLVPFKVECTDFPWLDAKDLPGAKGASGIGYLASNPTHKGRLFLPYYYANNPAADSIKTYLDCQVTILNDILFHYEVFFKINGKMYTSINLKDYRDGKTKIQFSRRYRKELPCGCKEPEGNFVPDHHKKQD